MTIAITPQLLQFTNRASLCSNILHASLVDVWCHHVIRYSNQCSPYKIQYCYMHHNTYRLNPASSGLQDEVFN